MIRILRILEIEMDFLNLTKHNYAKTTFLMLRLLRWNAFYLKSQSRQRSVLLPPAFSIVLEVSEIKGIHMGKEESNLYFQTIS